MNFLAHIYLSGDNDDLTIGNFMADPIKGKDYQNYSGDIKKGILLHRKIDSYTDAHPVVSKSTHRLFKNYRHYNGVIVDVFYDHFLAKNWQEYHPQDLSDYIQDFYRLIEDNFEKLPNRTKNMFPYMKAQNWLLSYREVSGIEKILAQMSARVKGNVPLNEAVRELNVHYDQFESEFRSFFPELQTYVLKQKELLNKKS